MAKLYIVNNPSTYTGPVPTGFTLHAPGDIWLRNGDEVILSNTLSSSVNFRPERGYAQSEADPVVSLEQGRHGAYNVTTQVWLAREDLSLKIQVPDDTDARNVNISASGTDGSDITVGSNSSIGNVTGGDDSGDNDRLIVGDGSSVGTINMGSGNNSVVIGSNATVRGAIAMGGGADTVEIGRHSVVQGNINAGDGANYLLVGDNVTLNGASNAITTGSGNDRVFLGEGVVAPNPIFTGPGSDTVGASTGDFTVDMGIRLPNDDTLIITASPGGLGDLTGALRDDEFSYDPTSERYYGGPNQTFTYGGITYENIDYIVAAPYCFAAGTMIETDRGAVAVEALAEGDLVVTRDNGLQPIPWIGSRSLSAQELAGNEKLRPIRIRPGALGHGVPAADLLVSPQHRVLVRSKIAQKMFGTDEVLVAAKQLCQIDGIDVAHDLAAVVYYHLLFDRHEVVISNGAETESLFTGPEALRSIGPAALAEILTLFPELADRDYQPAAARTLASGRLGRKLAVRHGQNAKPLVS
ncbi:Hint domain-containing protein [Paracoccus sanguinis]|uniref:Hint domain-containing protein n=1 Tax=Paracoccus sanguinis TaxID=1545044 RepID=UPI000A5E1238|nr:Hint domain-containing protein [Paracoccus sanguinis]